MLSHYPDRKRNRENQISENKPLTRIEEAQVLQHHEQAREHRDCGNMAHRQDKVEYGRLETKRKTAKRIGAQAPECERDQYSGTGDDSGVYQAPDETTTHKDFMVMIEVKRLRRRIGKEKIVAGP